MSNDLRNRVAWAIDPEAFEAHDTCLDVWESRRDAAYKAANAALAEIGEPAPATSAQEAARVLLDWTAYNVYGAGQDFTDDLGEQGLTALRAIAEGRDDE